MIDTLRRILLDGFRQRVHQTPTGRFSELLVRGRLELAKRREDVAGVDDAQLGSTHDAAPGFVIILLEGILQIFADGFGRQEIIFQRSDSAGNELVQINPACVFAVDETGATKCKVRAAAMEM